MEAAVPSPVNAVVLAFAGMTEREASPVSSRDGASRARDPEPLTVQEKTHRRPLHPLR